jgi:hypothetical protein
MFRTLPALLAVPVVALALLTACGERDTTSLAPAEPAAGVTAVGIASNTWQHLADLPTERRNAMLAAVTKANGDTRLFAIAGEDSATRINGSGNPVPTIVPVGTVSEWLPGTNRWVRRANTPYVWGRGSAYPEAVGIGSKIYIPGGFIRCGNCEVPRDSMAIYDATTDTWSAERLPQLATSSVSWAYQGQLYWYGHCNNQATGDGDDRFTLCTDTGAHAAFLLRYDPATRTWTYLATPSADPGTGATGVVGGRLYLASLNGSFNRLDVYDVARNRWSSGPSLSSDQVQGGGDAVKAKFYVVGGDGSQAMSEFDPATNSWRFRAPIPEQFSGSAWVRAARIVVDGQPRLAILGGLGHHWQWAP